MEIPRLRTELEVKRLESRQFEGFGSVFGNVDLGGDIVVKGAFRDSLRRGRRLPQMFWMHDPSRVAGKWLEMRENDRGLLVKGELANTPLGNEVHELLKMDAVGGLSIGFIPTDQDFDKDGNRLIKKAELLEVSVVSMPMNPLAEVSNVKSQTSRQGEYVPTRREFERLLRDWGCTSHIAKAMCSKLFADTVPSWDGEEPGRDVESISDLASVLDSLNEKISADILTNKLRTISYG